MITRKLRCDEIEWSVSTLLQGMPRVRGSSEDKVVSFEEEKTAVWT